MKLSWAILLINAPVPRPSLVLLFEIVGSTEVFQQIPLEITGDPPSFVTLPPEIAVVYEISVTGIVATEGGVGLSFLQE